MQTLQQTLNPGYTTTAKSESIISQFFSWCKNQEEFRYGWLAVIIAVHGCVLTPFTVAMITLSGNNIFLWFIGTGAMAMTMVTNLAALPTKITIPVFFLSIFIDVCIIAVSLSTIF
jgi:hypothetical protein